MQKTRRYSMTFLDTRRTSQSYEEKLKAKPINTRISHHTALNNFEKFCQTEFTRSKEDVIDEFLKVEKYVVFAAIQKWIDWNIKNNKNPSSLITWFSSINTYFYYKGLEFSQREIKENLDFPKMLQEELYGVQPEDLQKILKVANYRYRCALLAQTSTLMREGELMQIRKKHLVFDKDRIMIKIPAKFTKLRKARTVILSREATKPIMSKINKLDSEDLVWGSSEVKKDTKNYENAIRRYCKKVGLFDIYESNGRNKITSHSFRAFGITKISRHDENFAKMLAGQKGYLLQYDRLSDEEKLNLYMKFEEELAVDNSAKKQAELEKIRKEKSELEKEKESHELIKNQMNVMKQEIDELKYGQTGRKNKYNQGRLDAPDTLEAKITTLGIPILLELLFPEEKKRDMMKEIEHAQLENRKPDLHKIFVSKQMDEDNMQFLKKFLKEQSKRKNPSKPTNYVKPRLRIENLEAILKNHN